MEIEDIVESIEALIEEKTTEVWETGFADGYAEAMAELEEERESFSDGATKEQARVQSVLQMMFNFAMENNKMAEAKAWKNAMEIIKPINIDYSDDAYRKSMEDDGF
jgi:flagellar biosynthesis/type III secretory pathway protein FliH